VSDPAHELVRLSAVIQVLESEEVELERELQLIRDALAPMKRMVQRRRKLADALDREYGPAQDAWSEYGRF
jgi:chromosome segregation ATPase